MLWRPETLQEFSMVMPWRDAHVHSHEAELVKARRMSLYELVGS